MLQAFREHKRWLMFIAMVLIIPSFVVTGIYSYNRMIDSSDNAIVKVGEVAITPEMFDNAKRQQLERLRQQLGDAFRANMLENEQAREDILRMLMDDAAVTQTIAKNYIAVSEADAIALIKSAEGLMQNGKFSPELYAQFLQSQGKSDQQFVAEVQRDLAKEALVAGVAATYPVPKAIVQQMHEILTEERLVRTYIVNATDYVDQMTVTDEEAKAYYDANKQSFLSPEHVKAQYVVLSPENFRNVNVNPDDLKAYYEQNKNRWTTPEQRRASHILIEFGNDKAASQKKAEELMAEAKADPTKFAELAEKNSADPGSAAAGGDLSYFGRGMMTKPFEDAVFAAKKGDIVGPIETEFGYHIIYVTDVQESTVKPYEAVKTEIEREYVEQMSIRLFSEKAEEFTNIVYEQADTLEPAAEKFGLKLETVDFVTREGVKDPELRSIINDQVVEALFGSECLKEKQNSSAMEVRANTLVAARVLDYQPTHEEPFEKVRASIIETLKLQKATAKALEVGQAKLAEVRESKNLDGFSAETWVSRRDPKGQPEALVNAEVSHPDTKLPAYIGKQVDDGAYIISYISEAKKHPAHEQELAGLQRELTSIYGEADRMGYLEALEKALGVEVLKPNFTKDAEKEEAPL